MRRRCKILLTSSFSTSYRRLTAPFKRSAMWYVLRFRQNPAAPELFTHPLSGELSSCWSFARGGGYRIVFRITEKGEVVFIDMGNHPIYQ